MPLTTAFGDKFPIQGIGNYGFDGGSGQWIRVIVTGGALAVNIARWGGTVVTGRDVSLDLRALSDFTNIGIGRSIGDPGAAPLAPTTGKTLLALLEDIFGALGGTVNQHYETMPAAPPELLPLAGGNCPDQVFAQDVELYQFLVQGNNVDIQTRDISGVWNTTYIPVNKNQLAVIPLLGRAWRARNRGGAVYLPANQASVTATGYYA
jgi:hypothetical protein